MSGVLFSLFSRRWWWTTLLALMAVGVMIRLGIWQLDRLDQRRTFNARVTAQLSRPALQLDSETLDVDLAAMEYRSITVIGRYDHSQQVSIRNQVWDHNLPGVHLLTPLVISGTDQAVLVDRGWIPAEDAAPEHWHKYDEPGVVRVEGMIRASRSEPDFGGIPDPPTAPGEQLMAWNNVNVPRIEAQGRHALVPIYVQQAPDPAWTGMPYRDQVELDLSEGSHFGYAIQWFTFATVLAVGYPMYVRHHSRNRTHPVQNKVKESVG